MILVVDNYDSFTWTLVGYLRELGAAVSVVRNDALSAADALASGASHVLISPGPGRPEAAGVSLDLVAACATARRPLLGVCLGHQAIGVAFGAELVRAPAPVHGKTSLVRHARTGVFRDLPDPLTVARYHSLVLERNTVAAPLHVTAHAEDGTVQALRHRALPLHGVQFHPESIASECGHRLLSNFLDGESEPA